MTMSSLSDRFATLDRMPIPELWPDVEHRAAAFASADRVAAVAVRTRVNSTGSANRTLALLVGLLLVLLAGAVAVGSGLVRLPEVAPAPDASTSIAPSAVPPSDVPSLSAKPSGSPEPTTSVPAGRSPWIVYYGNDQLWAVHPDGTSAHPIRGSGPDAIAWSDDGTRMLKLNEDRVGIAEVGDDFGPFVETALQVAVNEQWEAFDFAPDGVRVVFVHKWKCQTASRPFGAIVAETAGPNCHALSTLDLRTGDVTKLDETLLWNEQPATNGSRELQLPAWSPDGTKIAFSAERPGGGWELWIVNADGTNPSKVELESDVSVREPRWSPDGTRISFTSETEFFSDSAVFVVDLASGQLDRITTEPDTAARRQCCAEWIDDTHLRLQDARPDEKKFWLVAIDGGTSEPQLLADLTGVQAGMRSAPGDPGRTFFWQPIPEAQP
jgi:WD40-like Beta Propeller Repeat